MSKKTFFKRVASSAIAGLGLGMLSVVPASAVVTMNPVTVTAGSASVTAGAANETLTAATISVSGLQTLAADSVTVSVIRKSAPATGGSVGFKLAFMDTNTSASSAVKRLIGGGSLTTVANGAYSGVPAGNAVYDSTLAFTSSESQIYIVSGGPAYVGARFGLLVDTVTTRVAGTYVFTAVVTAQNAGLAPTTSLHDLTFTINDTAANVAAAGGTIDPSKTTAILNAGTPSNWSSADSAVSAVATADSTNHASIRVRTYTSTSLAAPESVTATVTGPGLVCNDDASVCGKNLTIIGTGGDNTLRVRADGAAGVASIVIKTTTVTFPAKSVTFYAKAAKTITLSVRQPVISVGANTDVIRATALDADGNVWGGAAYILADAAADALIAGSTTPVACTFSAALGLHQCPVAGTAKGTANLKVIDAATVALSNVTSATAATRVSTGVATTAKISFDKATYEPGEKAQLRISILDGEGLAMPATTVTNAFAADLVSSRAFGAGSASLAGSTTVTLQAATSAASDTNAGHQTYVVYMPSTPGAITVSATGSTGLALAGRVAVSGTATVVDNSNQPAIDAATAATDAALEAIDAANAATDAANLAAEAADAATVAAEEARDAADAATAAVEALATEVASLIAGLKAQITTLANTVAKIAKKVKA